jgi:pyridoxine kinase
MSKRAVSIQDITCLGQCSLTAALPVLSACGVECAVLPTALLSTHTGSEFTPPHIRDLSPELDPIRRHWKEQGISFDAIEIGYLGSEAQISLVSEFLEDFHTKDCVAFLDPVMADHGTFYAGFDPNYARRMAGLCGKCDVILPNLTEACFLLGGAVPERYDAAYCLSLAQRLAQLGANTVIITGLALRDHQLSNLVYTAEGCHALINHVRLPGSYHGTGDLFASACLGRMLRGDSISEAVRRAGNFVSAAIANTPESKPYGTCFESCLHLLWA